MDEQYTFKSKFSLLSKTSKTDKQNKYEQKISEVKDIKQNYIKERSISFKGILAGTDVVFSNKPENDETHSTSDEESDKAISNLTAKKEIIKEDLILQNSNLKFM